MKKTRVAGLLLVAAVWLGLSIFAWLHPSGDLSEAERRPLAQFPEISGESLINGDFMEAFESYSLDQFPARDWFRQVKSLFHYKVLGQKDNNGIYLSHGYAAQLEYPLNKSSVDYAIGKFSDIYSRYLADTGSRIWFSVAPDKGFYLAEENGYPAMDYETLFSMLEAGLPWAEYVDLTAHLDIGDYYRTDTHWRQECLLPAAQWLCRAMDIPVPREADYDFQRLERPFYGVYYGQAALPVEPDGITLLESSLISHCRVYNYETGESAFVYDEKKLTSRDLYDVYLSGAAALLEVENPAGDPGRELILFRDSFGSSLAPLLLQGYSRVTLVDIRYVSSAALEQFIDFHGQDVLFLYSTLVLNNSSTLK